MVDTRTFPYGAVVLVTDTIGGVRYQGSGVLISPDEVLTAAHMVWSSVSGMATDIEVTPGYSSGIAPYGRFKGTATHVNRIDDAGGLIRGTDIGRDFAVIHLAGTANAGTFQIGADFNGGFATVSGYPGAGGGAQIDSVQYVGSSLPYNLLYGASLGPGSSGGPVWINGPGGPTVVGTVSGGDAAGNGYFMRISAAVRATILSWVAQDDSVPAVAGYIDSVTGQQGTLPLEVVPGAPSYLQWRYIWSSPNGVALSASTANVFLHGGAGQDSIQVTSGQNVLDGGAGSNFLTGGTGTDTFFTDARGDAPVWNTLRNFHAGDAATLWGFVPGVSGYYWDDQIDGAPGSTGATLRANIVGGAGRVGDGIDASITFAGLSVAQAKALHVSVGTQAAGSYLYFDYT